MPVEQRKVNFAAGLAFFLALLLLPISGLAATFFVATLGSDTSGDGSAASPWASITHALDNVVDGSTILVLPGTYSGRIRIRGTFSQGVQVRSELPYQAQLRHNDTVITAYSDAKGCEGITITGFDIAHSGAGSGALVVHVDGGGNETVKRITFSNNVMHDSHNNDVLKINNAARDITVQGNIFYNQSGSDEHIDINSVDNVVVEDNVFFNDFAGSGRVNGNNTSSYIVIKDSNQGLDAFVGSRNITVRRNVFLHWEGSSGSNFVLVGEDGQTFHEAFNVLIENNLMLGDAANVMRAAFGVKGGRDITFRNNTVAGDLPALAYAMRLNREGGNPANQNIHFYNNIWSDPTATMGSSGGGNQNDFSDTPSGHTTSFILDHNLYWNGGQPIPADSGETINFIDDANAVTGDPLLAAQSNVILPRLNQATNLFEDGSTSVTQVHLRLVTTYGAISTGSAALDQADPANAPAEDILGQTRDQADIGAYEFSNGGTGLPAILELLLDE